MLKISGEGSNDSCIPVWMYLTPLNYICKNVKIVNFVYKYCVYFALLKIEMNMLKFLINISKNGLQLQSS